MTEKNVIVPGVSECPKCHSTEIDMDDPDFDYDFTMGVNAKCDDCGASWINLYKFDKIENLKTTEDEDREWEEARKAGKIYPVKATPWSEILGQIERQTET